MDFVKALSVVRELLTSMATQLRFVTCDHGTPSQTDDGVWQTEFSIMLEEKIETYQITIKRLE